MTRRAWKERKTVTIWTAQARSYLSFFTVFLGAFAPVLSQKRDPNIYTLPNAFIRQYHHVTSSWQKVRLKHLESELTPYADEAGFEQIAQVLGVAKPVKPKLNRVPGPLPSSYQWLAGDRQ